MTRIFLDEGVPKPLARSLRAYGLNAVPFPNDWKQLSNGSLLARIESEGFDVILTCDKQMPFQQNLAGRQLAIVILPTTKLLELVESVGPLASVLGQARPSLAYRFRVAPAELLQIN